VRGVGLRLALLGAALAMIVFCAGRIGFATEVTDFLPAAEESELAALSRMLSGADLSRTMILAIGADAPETALAAAGELAASLRRHDAVAWVRNGLDPELPRHVYELYFPRRYLFLSERPEEEIPERVTEEALRAEARRLRDTLSLPMGTLVEQVAPEDPLGAFGRILSDLGRAQSRLQTDGGRFLSGDGEHAIVFLATWAGGFETDVQARLLADIDTRFRELDAQHGGQLTLEQSGVNRYVVAAEREIRSDVLVIAAFSFIGVAVLFLVFFRSPARFGFAVLPGAFGILVATSLGLLVFGSLGGITLAFGTSLIGVAIDYPIHVLGHHALAANESDARDASRRLRPSLALGAGTTMASFAGLGMTSVPTFREIAFFAVIGVGTALAFTLWVLPRLLPPAAAAPPLALTVSRVLGNAVRSLQGQWRTLALVPVAILVFAAVLVPRLEWDDRLAALSEPDPALVAEDERVREHVARFDTNRFVVALADDPAGALARNDEVYQRLREAIARGELAGARSLHDFLWSEDLQRRNWEQLAGVPGLADRVDQAFAAEGFAPGAFEPFRSALAGPAPEPLRWKELRDSPLGPLVGTMMLEQGGRSGAVTFLRGADPPALRAALADLPDVVVFDQTEFVNDLYSAFRATTLRQMAVGTFLVLLVLALRYRSWRPTVAAFLPSVLVALLLLAGLSAAGVTANLLHAMGLILVMGMGVDYGIFVVDSARSERGFSATMLSLLVSCLTTIFVFGTLALSSQPALRAIGLTTGVGILLSFLLAPLTFVVTGADRSQVRP
jgi:predicted exporter